MAVLDRTVELNGVTYERIGETTIRQRVPNGSQYVDWNLNELPELFTKMGIDPQQFFHS